MPKVKANGEAKKAPGWTHAKSQAVINGLILQKIPGKKAATGFKKEAWTVVTKESNNTYKCNLKNHIQTMVTGKPAFWAKYNLSHKGAAVYKKKPFPLYALINQLFGNVNATANGIVGTQTGSQPITQPAICPPANNPSSENLPAMDLTAETEPAEKEPAENQLTENQPTGKQRADNRFDLSDGKKDENDNVFCLPPPFKRQGLDDTCHYSEHSADNSDGGITHTSTPNTPKPCVRF
ncbi:hypothetical protein DFH28DRAFT_928506 [Melampsora americana]|nr:hypothetical protein DFH28DRAFT_928506 [Melampsora americana]